MVFRAGEEQIEINVYQADSDFVEIMGLRMAQGRALTDDPADAEAVVINETAARIMGLEEPLGETINAVQGETRASWACLRTSTSTARAMKIEPLIILNRSLDGRASFSCECNRPSRRRPSK